jgi:hypothetical protein
LRLRSNGINPNPPRIYDRHNRKENGKKKTERKYREEKGLLQKVERK